MDTPALLSFESSNGRRVRTVLWCGSVVMLAIAGAAALLEDEERSASQRVARAAAPTQAAPAVRPVAQRAIAAAAARQVGEPAALPATVAAPQRVPLAAPASEPATLAGIVHLPAGLAEDDALAVRVHVTAAGREEALELDATGGFGPLELAPGVSEVVVRVEGGGVVPEEERLAVASGQELDLALAPDLGHDLWFFVADASGEPLPGARLALETAGAGPAPRPNLEPRSDGYVRFRGIAPGQVWVRSTAPGRATRRDGPFQVPSAPEAIHVTLSPSASLAGSVTVAGEPAEDFRLVWWSAGAPAQHVHVDLEDRTDGTFELADVPAGPLYLTAQTTGLPPCAPVLVDPSQDEAPVELVLEPGVRLTGRVLSAEDGAALPGAQLVLASAEAGRPAASWGPRHPVGPDGRFTIEVAPAEGVLRVACEGFAERQIVLHADSEQLDLGDLGLVPPSPLTVFLEGVDDPEAFAVEGILGSPLPHGYFDEHGEVAYPGNQASDVHLQLTAPDGSYLFVSRTFRPGSSSELPIVLGSESLRLEVSEVGDAVLPLQVNLELPVGTMVYPLEGTRTAEFRYLEPGAYQASISDGKGAVVATQTLEVAGGSSLARISLDPGQKIARVLHEGEGLAGAEVYLFRRGEDLPLFKGTTGKQGRLALRSGQLAGGDELVATVEHRSLGVAADVPVRRLPGGALELEPSFGASLELTLLDGDRPVTGADVRLQSASGSILFAASATSDAQGLVRWPAVGDARYRVTVLRSGHWPETQVLAPGQHVLQVRALGDLEVQVSGPDGSPLAGARVSAVSAEYGVTSAQWLDAGAIDASSDELLTDAQGRVTIQGLPHGDYALEVDGLVVEPAFRVEPGTLNRAALLRP